MTSVTAATDARRLVDKLWSPKGESLITVGDALTADPGRRWSVVLANPLFGRKSSVTMIGAEIPDVLLYLLRLADELGIHVMAPARAKQAAARAKFPTDGFRGVAPEKA